MLKRELANTLSNALQCRHASPSSTVMRVFGRHFWKKGFPGLHEYACISLRALALTWQGGSKKGSVGFFVEVVVVTSLKKDNLWYVDDNESGELRER